MADQKANDPKPSTPKTGPVKPPVLDLKAREATADKPEAKPNPAATPATDTAASAKAAPSRPAPAKPASPEKNGFAIGAALTGGVLGLAAAYGLAWAGLWPTAPVPVTAADPRLAQFASAIPELETVTQTTQSELAALNQRIGALESAAPETSSTAGDPVDLTGVQGDIAALAQRVETLVAAPATPVDTSAVDALRGDLSALTTRLDEVAARLGSAEAGLRTLDTTVSQTSATLAAQPTDIGAVLQLPLILSGFESAFATGRNYETELAALRSAIPDVAIPTSIANDATNGLVRPDIIATRFAEVLPAMLAGRPANPDAQWQDNALEWFRSAIALRPSGEIAGETPEAVMSQLESAIARRDFAAAETLLASLPAPMLAAGGEVPALIAAQAEAARFLDALRASAMTGEATQ